MTLGTKVYVVPVEPGNQWLVRWYAQDDSRGVIVAYREGGLYVVRHRLSGIDRMWERRDLKRVSGMKHLAQVELED